MRRNDDGVSEMIDVVVMTATGPEAVPRRYDDENDARYGQGHCDRKKDKLSNLLRYGDDRILRTIGVFVSYIVLVSEKLDTPSTGLINTIHVQECIYIYRRNIIWKTMA